MSAGQVAGILRPFLSNQHVKFPEARQLTIQVQSWSNTALTLQVRGMSVNDLISHDHVTNSDRSVATTSHRLTDFPIFLRVNGSGTSIRRGDCYCKVTLQCAGFDVAILCAGYITNDFFLSYPQGRLEQMSEGRGTIREVAGTNPAAAAEIAETVPTNAQWRIIAVSAVFVADANTGNRRPSLTFTTGGNVLGRFLVAGNIVANETVRVTWASIGDAETVASQGNLGHLPEFNMLDQGTVIDTLTNNLQAGDDWAAPTLWVEEWIQE